MSRTIAETVSDYVHAMTFAEEDKLREIFDPRAAIVGNYQQHTEWLTLDDFIDQIHAVGSAPWGSDPVFNIIGIDRKGDAASVKLTDSFAGMDFTDYLSLLEIDDRWFIVHKLYHLHT